MSATTPGATASEVEVRAGSLADVRATRPALVLTDTHVEPLLPAGLRDLPRHVIPAGEASKSWAGLEALLLALDAAGLDRDGQLIAVGGGVVTDLGGLAASLHRRGLGWVAVPTSLLGQVDAAVGGKTAVNLGGGKNTVGSVHLPERVVVDPRALATLPERHLRAGLAEVLKTLLIAGGDRWRAVCELQRPGDLADGGPAACALIQACLDTKLALVAADLHDTGERQRLNLGHTFGHAFEALAMPELLHGEAVGLGILCAARQAHGPGGELEATCRELLARWGLPLQIDLDPDRLLAEMGRDKKRAGGRLTLILPRAPGRVERVPGVEPEAVRAALAAALP